MAAEARAWTMDLLPDTYNCALRMRHECRERFSRHRLQRGPLVTDSGVHHGTSDTHVPWCMSGSLTHDDGENVPCIPGACTTTILRIWQEAHTVYMGGFGHASDTDGIATSLCFVAISSTGNMHRITRRDFLVTETVKWGTGDQIMMDASSTSWQF